MLFRSSFTPPNHKSALDHPDIISTHISNECALGRYTGPFSASHLEALIGPFRSSPLGLADKPNSPGDFRVIQDFSFPHNSTISSVNSEIDMDKFRCHWGTFVNIISIVVNAHPLAEAATLDAPYTLHNRTTSSSIGTAPFTSTTTRLSAPLAQEACSAA